MFLYYANEGNDDVIGGFTKTVQLNQEYLQTYWSNVVQTWHQKCTSQKKQNDTYCVVFIATILAPVSLCEKPNIPICNLLNWDGGSSSEHTTPLLSF